MAATMVKAMMGSRTMKADSICSPKWAGNSIGFSMSCRSKTKPCANILVSRLASQPPVSVSKRKTPMTITAAGNSEERGTSPFWRALFSLCAVGSSVFSWALSDTGNS